MREHLPEVYAQIDDSEAGLLHCEMGVLERAALDVYNERLNVAKYYFDFASEVLRRAEPDVLNALNVSFIEGFALGSPEEQQARAWMPEKLQCLYDEYAKNYVRQSEDNLRLKRDA